MLKCELNSNLKLNHIEFNVIYFAVLQVVDVATKIFEKCYKGKDLLYTTSDGQYNWEKHYKKDVQQLLEECVNKFIRFLNKASIKLLSQQQFMPLPNTPISGPIKQKLNLCIATFAKKNTGISNKRIVSWHQILIFDKLKFFGHDGLEKT